MKILVLVLLMAGSLQARGHDYLGHSLFAAGTLLDLATTRVALHNGAVETSLIGSSLSAQAGAKIGLVAMVEGLSWAAARDGHPTLARNNRIVWGLIQIGVGAWNGRVIARQHRKHSR